MTGSAGRFTQKISGFRKIAVRAAIPQRLLKTNKFVIADSAVRVSFIADDQAAREQRPEGQTNPAANSPRAIYRFVQAFFSTKASGLPERLPGQPRLQILPA